MRVARRLRVVVVKVGAAGRVVIVVADRHVRGRLIGDDSGAELHEPWRIVWVGHFGADQRVPRL